MIYALDELEEVAQKLADRIQKENWKLILLDGPMGSGKTTLVSAICKALGVQDTVSSPTYAIAQEYQVKSKVIHHLDLYRLNDIEEAIEAGIEEYLDSDALTLIEWPNIITPLLPESYKTIEIKVLDEYRREIHIFTV